MGMDNDGVDWIPNHMQRGLDADKIVYFSVPVVSKAVLIRRYLFSCCDRGVYYDGESCAEVWVIEVR